MAENLTELELKAFKDLKVKEQELNEGKFKLGDLDTYLESLKKQVNTLEGSYQELSESNFEKAKEFSKEWMEFVQNVKKQYGEDVQIDEDGNIVKGEEE